MKLDEHQSQSGPLGAEKNSSLCQN